MVRPIQSCLEEFQLLPAPEPLHAERPVRPMAEIRRAGASEDAWQRGYEEGRAKAQAQADAQLAEALEQARAQADAAGRAEAARETREIVTAELTAMHERALGEARATWVAEESARLTEALESGLAELRLRLAGKLARALEPFLAEALREKACAEMARMLERLFAAGEAGAEIRVEGPQDLIDALRAALPEHPGLVMHAVPGRADIRVSCADTTLETQIAQWSRILSGDVSQP
ncbi:MAG: hypothetical protein HLUCCO17_09230 [Saliniramus fredricksonii]|uniref:Flagellar assembly protein FliH n=1 Tax=Saliniramus fredricksonii TaxID=1653334 RepID=A0A0P8BML6_9HYPH|nr:hypothetical protein [Saliniramus fredricksonii]KPQ10861.1 MAG: hypothetical protein HLUCCO17_09230 [Saliniramus fredricksonii]SCC81087.1 hypothetical protein GA0071312_2017 [Saliniramus fredricksonii]